jgi:hypothetical protein
MEHARLDRVQHLGHEAEQPDAGGTIPLRLLVAVQLRLLRLRQHVEPEPEILLVPEAIHRRGVAVDGQLQ